jgi:hypothetical protein
MRRTRIALILVASLASAGQSQSVPTVTVRGSVLDAVSSQPLAGARLTLTGTTPTLFPSAGPSPVIAGSRVAVTDSAGGYEIPGIPLGEYRLFVRRLGYRPALLDLDARTGDRDANLSVGLVVVPVRLQSIQVNGDRVNLFGRLRAGDDSSEVTRPAAALARQTEFLGTDVRELTMLGALEGGSSGETDVFRALRRLPGVTGFDDRSAEIWVRGTRWDQVRIAYDGMPIFNPFHASGTMTGIGSDAIGAVFLHPGVRPVSLLAQGSSLVDIRSRAANDTGRRWFADLSPRDLGLSLAYGRPGGGLTISGRRSARHFLDLPFMSGDADVPGYYSEIALRHDRDFGNGRSLELTWLSSHDWATEEQAIHGPLYGGRGLNSGNTLYRATFTKTGSRFRLSHTAGMSKYFSDDAVQRLPVGVIDTSTAPYNLFGTTSTQQSNISFATFRGDLGPAESTATRRWTAGYQLSEYHSSSTGLMHAVTWWDQSRKEFHLQTTRAFGALWAERRWTPQARLSIDAGTRVESELGRVSVRLAPSLQARYRLDGATNLSIGAGRTYQDAQELPFTTPTTQVRRGFWVLSPAMRADQASVGVERWFGESVVFDLNGYARLLSNVAIRPLPAADSAPQPLFNPSRVQAGGIEIGLRKLAGRVTGSVGYTIGRATERVDGATFTGSGDRTHAFDATAMARFGRYRIGTGFTWMTGAPYTRIIMGEGTYVRPANDYPANGTIDWVALPRAETRNAERLPDFASMDLSLERFSRIGNTTLTPYLGAQNLLQRTNFTAVQFRWASTATEPDYLIVTRHQRLVGGLRVVF